MTWRRTPRRMTPEEIEREIERTGRMVSEHGSRRRSNCARIIFWATIRQSNGADFQHAIPADLTGKTVLDIGCNAGFYSIEMKRRGAARVLGIDFDPGYLAQARFAAEVHGLDIEFRQMSVYDVAQLQEKFDLVLFMGVLYHLRHPLLALDLIHEHVAPRYCWSSSRCSAAAARCRRWNRITPFGKPTSSRSPAIPLMYFVEQSYSHDPTNWWIPNRACAEAMLRSAGFEIVEHPEEEVYICRRRARAWLKRRCSGTSRTIFRTGTSRSTRTGRSFATW